MSVQEVTSMVVDTGDLSDGCRAALDAIHREPQPAVVAVTGGEVATVLQVAAITWMLLNGDRVLWSAGDSLLARRAFESLTSAIGADPVLSRHVRRVSAAIGAQEIEADNGARILFRSRNVRGFAADRLIVSEADGITWDALRSLLPVTMRRPDATVVYGADEITGEVLADIASRVLTSEPGDSVRVVHCRT